MQVHLVNPSHVSFGVGVITPRWLFVIAAATPAAFGDPRITDETLEPLDPDRIVMMSGDIDSRVSDPLDGESDSPGANDNASGVAGTLEAARVLSRHRFAGSIAYAALSGEEQGLYGGRIVAAYALQNGWRIKAVLNNDMIGNIAGIDGVTTVKP